jgi:hypothetical protein
VVVVLWADVIVEIARISFGAWLAGRRTVKHYGRTRATTAEERLTRRMGVRAGKWPLNAQLHS